MTFTTVSRYARIVVHSSTAPIYYTVDGSTVPTVKGGKCSALFVGDNSDDVSNPSVSAPGSAVAPFDIHLISSATATVSIVTR